MPSSPNTPPEPLPADQLILETERLRLRPLELDDLDLSITLYTDPEVTKYVCDLMTPAQLERDMPTWVRRGAGGRIGIWCVSLKETGVKLATSILLPLPIEEDDTDMSLVEFDRYPDAEIEIGYVFKRAAWGKGYATEACSRLLRFAFEQTALEEVVATTDHANTASQHVLKKCGWQLKGTRRAYAEDGCPDFRITRAEWLTQQRD